VWLNRILKDRLGITDADLGIGMAPVAAAAAPAAGEQAAAPEAAQAAEEKKEFTVVIEGYDAAAKIKIIKELRAVVPELGLKEAKALVRTSQPPQLYPY
jgi:large subunit ribosomal protein L7/L12